MRNDNGVVIGTMKEIKEYVESIVVQDAIDKAMLKKVSIRSIGPILDDVDYGRINAMASSRAAISSMGKTILHEYSDGREYSIRRKDLEAVYITRNK